jgi:galactonate dehydratase
LVGARPAEGKKGADQGIDGRIYFHEGDTVKTKQIILSVKAGKLHATYVRDLRGVVEREKAEIGVLLALDEPTKAMRTEAASAGFYKSPWGQHPRLQIVTVGELLAGKRLDIPPVRQTSVTYKRAPKVVLKAAEQRALYGSDDGLDFKLDHYRQVGYLTARPIRRKSHPSQSGAQGKRRARMDRREFLLSSGVAAVGIGAGSAVVAQGSAAAAQASRAAPKLTVTGFKTIQVGQIRSPTDRAKWQFLQLQTNEGLVGLGEQNTGGATNLKWQTELLHDLCERFVVGQSPFNIEAIWQNIYTGSHDYRHPSLYLSPALSAIEMACWDLVGKALGQPIYNLLGGQVRDRIRGYAYLNTAGVWENPKLAGERAAALVADGQTCCKLDPFAQTNSTPGDVSRGPRDFPLATIRHTAEIFRAIRDAVGDKLEVALGTHGQFTTSGAIRVASILEEFNPYWFEEPVSPENMDEMARVAAHTTIPIATGERLVTKFEFAQLLHKQAAQILQLDVGRCGGILEAKKIAAMGEASYAMIAPHFALVGPIAAAAAVQLDTCCPNFLIQEFNVTQLNFDILMEPLTLQKGFITPPTKPGLGVELNDKVVQQHLSA